MKHLTTIIVCTILVIAQGAFAGIDYNFISSNDLMKLLNQKKPVHMIDVQKKNDFLLQHFAHSIGTSAYPVKTPKDTDKIRQVLDSITKTDKQIVIIGPRGTRASKRTVAYLLKRGIAPERIAILKKGTRGWPTPEILLNTSGT